MIRADSRPLPLSFTAGYGSPKNCRRKNPVLLEMIKYWEFVAASGLNEVPSQLIQPAGRTGAN